MSDYTPTTEQAKEYFSAGCAHFWEENGEELFDRWLQSVKDEERERIIWQLENIATHVIKSGNEYWDGYVRALEDVRLDNWPLEAPVKVQTGKGAN